MCVCVRVRLSGHVSLCVCVCAACGERRVQVNPSEAKIHVNDAAACRLCFFPSGGAAAGPGEFSGQTTPALSVRTSGTGRRETGAQIFQRPKAPHGAAIVCRSAGSLAKVGGQGEVCRGVVAVPLKKTRCRDVFDAMLRPAVEHRVRGLVVREPQKSFAPSRSKRPRGACPARLVAHVAVLSAFELAVLS